MDGHKATGGQAETDAAAPARRFVVIVGKPAADGVACRIEEPGRLLRVWSLLQATDEQLDWAALPAESVPALRRQVQVIRDELERAVSPPLAAELRRILPPHAGAPSAGALRIDYAVLSGWAGGLMVQMLRTLAAAQEQVSRPSAAA